MDRYCLIFAFFIVCLTGFSLGRLNEGLVISSFILILFNCTQKTTHLLNLILKEVEVSSRRKLVDEYSKTRIINVIVMQSLQNLIEELKNIQTVLKNLSDDDDDNADSVYRKRDGKRSSSHNMRRMQMTSLKDKLSQIG